MTGIDAATWNGLLLLVVALVSIVVFRFCIRKADKLGAVNPSKRLATAGTADGHHVTPSSPPNRVHHRVVDQHPATVNSTAFAVGNAEPPDKASTFATEFHHAVELKTINMLAEAGQHICTLVHTSHL